MFNISEKGVGHVVSRWQSSFSLQMEVARGATVTHSFMMQLPLAFLSI